MQVRDPYARLNKIIGDINKDKYNNNAYKKLREKHEARDKKRRTEKRKLKRKARISQNEMADRLRLNEIADGLKMMPEGEEEEEEEESEPYKLNKTPELIELMDTNLPYNKKTPPLSSLTRKSDTVPVGITQNTTIPSVSSSKKTRTLNKIQIRNEKFPNGMEIVKGKFDSGKGKRHYNTAQMGGKKVRKSKKARKSKKNFWLF